MADETKAPARRFRLIPGQRGKVKVLLSQRPDSTTGGEGGPPEDLSGGLLPPSGVEDDDLIPARKAGQVQLFDLATRLASTADELPAGYEWPIGNPAPQAHNGYVNEYVDLGLSVEVVAGGGFSPELLNDLWAVDDALLGSRGTTDVHVDILGTTPANTTGQPLPNVLLVPHAAQSVTPWIGMSIWGPPARNFMDTAGEPQIWASYGEGPETEKSRRFAALGTGHWGPLNVADKVAPFTGAYKVPRKRKWMNFRFDGATPLNGPGPFFFKWTREPRYGAHAVEPPTVWTPPLKVYLTPSLYYLYTTEEGATGPARKSSPIRPFGAVAVPALPQQVAVIDLWPRKLLAIFLNKGREEYYLWQFDVAGLGG